MAPCFRSGVIARPYAPSRFARYGERLRFALTITVTRWLAQPVHDFLSSLQSAGIH